MRKEFYTLEKRYLSDLKYKNKKGKWILLSDWDIHTRSFTDAPATYVFYLDGELGYIGQSNTPRFRFTQHKICQSKGGWITPWGEFRDMYVKLKYSLKYGQEAMTEKRLIKRLTPRFNKYKCKYKKRAR